MKKHRLLTHILIMLLIIASLLTVIRYGLPVFLKPKILELIQQQTGRKATLDKCQFALIPLSIQLQNFTIPEHNGKPFASIANFYAEINIRQSLGLSALVIEKLTIANPVVHIVKQKNAKFNFEDLIKAQSDKQSDAPVFPLKITTLSLSDGKVSWDDPSSSKTFQPIDLTVNNLSTFTDKKSRFDLQLALKSGGNLGLTGEIGLTPLISGGHISLKNIKLDQSVLATSLPFDLSGHGILDSDYQVSYGKQGFTLTATKAKVELHDFKYAEKDNKFTIIKAAHCTHEADFKFTYTDNNWSLTSQKYKINLHNFDYTDTVIDVKAPNLNAESDLKLQTSKQHLQLSANKLRLDGKNMELQYANSKFKTPEINLETAIDGRFTEKTQLNLHHGKLNTRHIQLFDKVQDNPLIDISELAVNGVDFDLSQQSVNIDTIKADNADSRLTLTSKGTNYQTLFTDRKTDSPEVKSNPVSAKAAATSPPWAIKINQLALTQWATHFEDQTQHKPVIINFKPADFKLTGYSNKTGAKLPFQLKTNVNNTGIMQLDGSFVADPFAIQLAIDAKAIDLEPFQPYLDNLAHLDIIDGKLSTIGKLAISTPDNQPLDLKFTGDSSISDLITRDQKRHRDFIKWKTLSLKAFAADLRKDSYTADSLIIDKPYVKVTIRKDKTLNFADVFMTDSQPSSKTVDKTPEPHQQQTYFKLNKLQIIDGSSDFADKSLILPFATRIQSLDGGAHDISSDQKSRIKVSLKGNVYDLAPVDIDGYINPYSGNSDLTVKFKGMPMPLISSYMVEFAGYKIENGKMSLQLKYKVVDDILTASNNIEIDQFELGEKVENPKAVSLPLEMAVALLKDADGKIIIDVPITGSLNDPQFDIGSIIADALGNAIRKVVTSPFDALAALAGDDEASISNINFKAGDAVLDKTQQDKLTTVAKLLKERSVLVLNIKGTAFEAQDWPAIQQAALYKSMKKIRAEELNQQSGNTKTQADYVELSEADYKRLLAQEFIAKFPKLAKKSFFGTPELIDAKGDFYEVAKQQLSANLKSANHLKELATQRAQATASFLVKNCAVANEQVFILSPAVDSNRDNKEINTILSLKAR